jgi:hypothetical protein
VHVRAASSGGPIDEANALGRGRALAKLQVTHGGVGAGEAAQRIARRHRHTGLLVDDQRQPAVI